MSVPADTIDSSHFQPAQGTTREKCISADELLALRAFFLLLDAWDRNSKPATPVDTQAESEQRERHAQSTNTRRQRAA